MIASKSSFGLFPIRIFVKFNAFLDFTDDETGDTALHLAMARQNFRGAVELICAGADETKTNKKGETPYDLVDSKSESLVQNDVATQMVRENGTVCEKMTSRWFLIQLFTATITAIAMAAGLTVLYFTNFWVLLVGTVFCTILVIYFGQYVRVDQMAMLPVTYICYVGVVELAILIYDTDGLIHWSIMLLMCTIWAISASFYWILIFSNPGAKPRSTNPFPELIENVETHGIASYCFTCWIPKNPTSHHCSQCDKCVDGFDHHCPWIHKCVYRKNLRIFVLFCLTNFMFDVMYVPLLAYVVVMSLQRSGFEQTVADHGIMIISLGVSVFHAFGATAITFTQFSQISRHVTTIQTIKRTTTTAPTTTTVSADFEPWNHGPSMMTRVQNVWNLLLFDRFFAEPDDDYWTLSMTSSTRDQSTEVTSTKTG
uniref:Palmitoyltransferase n=1 Tax=Caenorhabditis japonica TaxID=281687 RepID=A0A8R1HU17_CAEJA